MKQLIEKLITTPGPSGYEGQIRKLVQEEVKPFSDEIHVDALGNLIARKGSQSGGLKIMIAGHIDEIGIIATHIDDNGFIRFSNLGGVYPRYAPGGRVRFLDGTLGVIGIERIKDPYRVPPLSKMYIDVGASDKNECPIQVGDVAVFERPFSVLGNRLVSKAMDDRISVAVMIETLRNIKQTPHELYFVFTVQEEVGIRGATTAAYSIDPDLGLALDVTMTGDTPKGVKMEVSLGKGPAVKVKDSSMLADPRVVRWIVDTAEKSKIPYQLEILEAGGTDAHAIQLTRAGVPAGCISIPCRYLHSPSEMVDINDVQNTVALLTVLLSKTVRIVR
jgi:endoglucanase